MVQLMLTPARLASVRLGSTFYLPERNEAWVGLISSVCNGCVVNQLCLLGRYRASVRSKNK